MIQVDFFWAYAFGATFAFAACRQIREETCKWYESKYFTWTVFYLAIFFAPSGVWLLQNHTAWETMQVWRNYYNIPAVLVLAFAITNVLDGVIAYYICHRLIKKGNYYYAGLQVILGYFIMFFILAHGWDGWGFDRFFYDPHMNNEIPWSPGSGNVLTFLTTSIGITLLTMGVFILPPMFYFTVKWMREGQIKDEAIPNDKVRSPMVLTIVLLVVALGVALGLAVGATLVCKLFTAITGGNQIIDGEPWSIVGMLIGLPVFCIPAFYFLMRRGTLGHKFMVAIFFEDPIDQTTEKSK